MSTNDGETQRRRIDLQNVKNAVNDLRKLSPRGQSPEMMEQAIKSEALIRIFEKIIILLEGKTYVSGKKISKAQHRN